MTQRPSGRTLGAAAGAGVLAGGVIVAAVGDRILTEPDLTGITAAALGAAVSLAAVRQWFRIRAGARLLVEQQQRVRADELDRREGAVAARERAARHRQHAHETRVRILTRRLDTARSQLAAKTTALEELQRDYREVSGDYNAVIEHLLLTGHDRFTSSAEGGCPPARPYQGETHRRSPAPVTVLHPREHQDSG